MQSLGFTYMYTANIFATSNGDQIRQGIINIGKLCEGYPPFMHELNSVMPTGYWVEVLNPLIVKLFEPNNETSIIRADGSRYSITSLGHLASFDAGPNQQGKSMSGAPNRSTLANQDSFEAAITQQEETCNQQSLQEHGQNMITADQKSILAHYFAQPEEPQWTTAHSVVNTENTPELSQMAESYSNKIEVSCAALDGIL